MKLSKAVTVPCATHNAAVGDPCAWRDVKGRPVRWYCAGRRAQVGIRYASGTPRAKRGLSRRDKEGEL